MFDHRIGTTAPGFSNIWHNRRHSYLNLEGCENALLLPAG